jgi:hypothetical protein
MISSNNSEYKCVNEYSYSKILKILPKLIDTSEKSIITHQHAAVLLINGNPIAWDFNSIKGKRPLHAEVAVIRQYLISRGLIGWVRQQCSLRGSRKQKREKVAQEYFPITA